MAKLMSSAKKIWECCKKVRMKINKYLLMLCFFLLLGCLSTGSSGEDSPITPTKDTTSTDDDTTSVKQEEVIEFSITSKSYSSWSDTGYSVTLLFPDKPKNEQYDSLAVSIFLIENLVEELVLKKSISQKIYLQDSKEYKFSYFAYEKNSDSTSDTLFLNFNVPNSQPIVNINTNFWQHEMKINTKYIFDLSGSYDRDGVITKIFVDWGDGTSQTYDSVSEIFSHTYLKPIQDKDIIFIAYDNSNQENNHMEVRLSIAVAGSQKISPYFDMSVVIDGKTYTNAEISSQELHAGDLLTLDASTSLASEEAEIESYKWEVYWENDWHTIATKSTGNSFAYKLNWIGNAIVRLTIEDSNGEEASYERVVCVTNRPPSAKIVASVTSGYAPLQVIYNVVDIIDNDMYIKKLGSNDKMLDNIFYKFQESGTQFSVEGNSNRGLSHTVTYNNIGTGTMKLLIWDENGGYAESEVEVEVLNPEACFEVKNQDGTYTKDFPAINGDVMKLVFNTINPDFIDHIVFYKSENFDGDNRSQILRKDYDEYSFKVSQTLAS